MTNHKRDKKIDRAIRLSWSSLESHLQAIAGPSTSQRAEGYKFHKECVKEYAELITLLSDLY